MRNSNKFIGQNRAPRVHIEYEVHLPDRTVKKVELPFVIGVLADLAGKPVEKPLSLEKRDFVEIDVDNFESRMKAMKPRVAFQVPNTLTGQGQLPVELTFESMADFTPAAIAQKVEPLRRLLEARTQLQNLTTYMDGKSDVEELLSKVLTDPALMQALAAAPKVSSEPATLTAPSHA